MKIRPLFSATMFSAMTFAAAFASASPFRLGEPVPELSLPNLENGRPLSLSDFRGRKLMLHVWASW